MRHAIVDPSFARAFLITNSSITYTGVGFNLSLFGSKNNIIAQAPGYNVFQLSIPIVSSHVVIQAEGVLTPTGRMLEEEKKILKILATAAYEGEILTETGEGLLSIFILIYLLL
jgi:hypothetical protein